MTNKIFEIGQSEEIDLSEVKAMIKAMMKNMTKSFDAKDTTVNKASAAIDEIEMDVTKRKVFTFDYNSGWVTQAVSTGKMVMFNPKQKSRILIVTTSTIR